MGLLPERRRLMKRPTAKHGGARMERYRVERDIMAAVVIIIIIGLL